MVIWADPLKPPVKLILTPGAALVASAAAATGFWPPRLTMPGTISTAAIATAAPTATSNQFQLRSPSRSAVETGSGGALFRGGAAAAAGSAYRRGTRAGSPSLDARAG